MQRKAIAALMISLLLLSACGHGAGEQTFEAFRDTLTGKLVTVTAQVCVQRGDTVTDYTLTCQELPDGYDTVISEDGGNISQGQKQLLCITRVMLCLPPMLILDEATSAADPENQVEIDRAIENLCRGKTVVIVAHRLGAIKLCDKVAVVENNTITCCGTHEEMLEKNEYYRRAWADYRAARAIAYSVEGGVQHA